MVPVWIFCKVVVVFESSSCLEGLEEILSFVGTDKNDKANLPLRSQVDGEANKYLWHETVNRTKGN